MILIDRIAARLGYQRIPVEASQAPQKERNLIQLQQTMEAFQVVEAILPAAKKASQLRACGLRLVGSQAAIQALLAMAGKGDESAELVVGNLLPQGHPEVVRH